PPPPRGAENVPPEAELNTPPLRERCAWALAFNVGKNPARAWVTIASDWRYAASDARKFWFETSIWRSRLSSPGSRYTDHHAPRPTASAGRANRHATGPPTCLRSVSL